MMILLLIGSGLLVAGLVLYGRLKARRRSRQVAESEQYFVPHVTTTEEFMCVCMSRPATPALPKS